MSAFDLLSDLFALPADLLPSPYRRRAEVRLSAPRQGPKLHLEPPEQLR
jgi:hypothetical protein